MFFRDSWFYKEITISTALAKPQAKLVHLHKLTHLHATFADVAPFMLRPRNHKQKNNETTEYGIRIVEMAKTLTGY